MFILLRLVQLSNAPSPIEDTERGIVILLSLVQISNILNTDNQSVMY